MFPFPVPDAPHVPQYSPESCHHGGPDFPQSAVSIHPRLFFNHAPAASPSSSSACNSPPLVEQPNFSPSRSSNSPPSCAVAVACSRLPAAGSCLLIPIPGYHDHERRRGDWSPQDRDRSTRHEECRRIHHGEHPFRNLAIVGWSVGALVALFCGDESLVGVFENVGCS